MLVAVALVLVTRPIAPGGTAGATALPIATPFLVGEAKEGVLRLGWSPLSWKWTGADGRPRLCDLDGRPVRLEDLRGKLVLLNFWARGAAACQGVRHRVLRDLYEEYRDRGL